MDGRAFEGFMALSRELTADPDLAPALGRLHVRALTEEALAPLVARYLSLPAEGDRTRILREQIMNDDTVGDIAREVILIWLTGTPNRGPDGTPAGWPTVEAYFGATLWRLCGAHPPGYSDGYFGHWKYPPDR